MTACRDVLLDRDGVLIARREGYVLAPDEVLLIPGAADAVRRLRAAGHRVFVVTNQSPVGRGLLTSDRLSRIHQRVTALIRAEGGDIDGYFICPHHPDAGCTCRKPRPGLLHAARDIAGVELRDATLVGDQTTDIEAAQAAGCHAILVSCDAPPELAAGVPVVARLTQAADLILARDRARGVPPRAAA